MLQQSLNAIDVTGLDGYISEIGEKISNRSNETFCTSAKVAIGATRRDSPNPRLRATSAHDAALHMISL